MLNFNSICIRKNLGNFLPAFRKICVLNAESIGYYSLFCTFCSVLEKNGLTSLQVLLSPKSENIMISPTESSLWLAKLDVLFF